MIIRYIKPVDLKLKLDQNDDVLLIDIRENYEKDICKIDSTWIPMSEIINRKSEIPSNKEVVFFCKSGKRASAVVKELQEKEGFRSLSVLEGGILAWIEEVDKTLESY
jgi:rhodanese-related sulfurtransferase